MHEAYKARFPGKEVLEISSKSLQGGEAYSAFYLPKYVPALGRSVPLENVFQAGKIFENGGPYEDLMGMTPREAKRDERLRTSGKLIGFTFDGRMYPTEPKTAFYDFIYISALLENPVRAEKLVEYDAFTDIEFNPQKSLNCQAKAAAIFVSLHRNGLTGQIRTFEDFMRLTE